MKTLRFTNAVLMLLVLLGSLLISGCGVKTVKPEDVYKSNLIDEKFGGSSNITVEDTASGTRVVGKDFAINVTYTPTSFNIVSDPKDQEINYTMAEAIFDPSGNFVAKAQIKLGEGSTVAAKLPLGQGGMVTNMKAFGVVPGVSGSKNVTIKINPEVGKTSVAGLTFTKGAVMNVWDDGTVELDQENITATDEKNQGWVSKKVKLNGKMAVLMILKKK